MFTVLTLRLVAQKQNPIFALVEVSTFLLKKSVNMGRVKASKITGKFYLRTDRNPDKNGKYAIYLDYVLILNTLVLTQRYGLKKSIGMQKSV